MRKIALTGVLAAVLMACGAYALTPQEQLLAEAGARDYAERSGGKFISCSGQDSDGDGYVTCAVQIASASEDLLCSYTSRGCKKK